MFVLFIYKDCDHLHPDIAWQLVWYNDFDKLKLPSDVVACHPDTSGQAGYTLSGNWRAVVTSLTILLAWFLQQFRISEWCGVEVYRMTILTYVSGWVHIQAITSYLWWCYCCCLYCARTHKALIRFERRAAWQWVKNISDHDLLLVSVWIIIIGDVDTMRLSSNPNEKKIHCNETRNAKSSLFFSSDSFGGVWRIRF